MKKKRIVDKEVLKLFRGKPCEICGKSSDPCHIKTRGSGGDDHYSNLISFCRVHHTEQGTVGWLKFANKYPIVKIILSCKGWVWDGPRLRFEGGFYEQEESKESR